MRKLSFVFITLAFVCNLNAQLIFQHRIGGAQGEAAKSIIQTSDGGYILGGSTSSVGFVNAYLIKLNSTGNLVWTKTYGNSGWDAFNSVYQTKDGGYICAGVYEDPISNNPYAMILKTDNSGAALWAKTFTGNNFSEINSIVQTGDSGYCFTGGRSVMKTDKNGNISWSKTIYFSNNNSIKQTSDGGFVITGQLTSTFQYPSIIKLDPNGNVTWSKTYSDGATGEFFDIIETGDGGFVASGFLNKTTWDLILLKVGKSGNYKWAKSFDGGNIDQAKSLVETSDKGFAILANSSGSPVGGFCLIKTDSLGIKSWDKYYGSINGGNPYSMKQTLDGGYIFSGSWAQPITGNNDIYVVKTDPNGESGCNQTTPTITVNSPIINVSVSTLSITNGHTNTTNTIIVNSTGTLTIMCTNIGIQENTLDQLSHQVYPIPSTNFLKIENNLKAKIDLVIVLDLTGRKVLEERENTSQINIESLEQGMYQLLIFSEGRIYSSKFIKE